MHSLIESAAIQQTVISDHAPLSLNLADIHPKGRDFIWRFPFFLAKDKSFQNVLRDWWLEFSSDNEGHRDNPFSEKRPRLF